MATTSRKNGAPGETKCVPIRARFRSPDNEYYQIKQSSTWIHQAAKSQSPPHFPPSSHRCIDGLPISVFGNRDADPVSSLKDRSADSRASSPVLEPRAAPKRGRGLVPDGASARRDQRHATKCRHTDTYSLVPSQTNGADDMMQNSTPERQG